MTITTSNGGVEVTCDGCFVTTTEDGVNFHVATGGIIDDQVSVKDTALLVTAAKHCFDDTTQNMGMSSTIDVSRNMGGVVTFTATKHTMEATAFNDDVGVGVG